MKYTIYFLIMLSIFLSCEKDPQKPSEDESEFNYKNVLKVMTYNIAFSGGAIKEALPIFEGNPEVWLQDRTPQLISIIKEVDPDILGIQEAFMWDSYDPPYYQRFANSIGMEYYYFPTNEWNGICVYSKFPIISGEHLIHQNCFDKVLNGKVWNGNHTVKVIIKTPYIDSLNVYVCHLDCSDGSAKIRECEINEIVEKINSTSQKNIILMGDMNFNIPLQPEFKKSLKSVGLQWLGDFSEFDIDQIWATRNLYENSKFFSAIDPQNGFMPAGYNEILPFGIVQLIPKASDHFPAIAYFGFD